MSHHHDMYYDNPSRSPGSHRHPSQTLHRQPSRQFDSYAQLPGLYTADDHVAAQQQPPPQQQQPQQPQPQASYALPRYTDRLNATLGGSNYGGAFDVGAAPAWNTFGGHGQGNNIMNASTRLKQPAARGRSNLPSVRSLSARPVAFLPNRKRLQNWLDQTQPLGSSNHYGNMPPLGMRSDAFGQPDTDEELIPTAIVIKNIPFAVKKEQLVQLMTDMRLPLPYAFNYHFDNGVFRGLAFANFTTAEETAAVIEGLNHFELHGRKLRVEYKKMLPLAERERIEREKRERRGQLEEQHRPLTTSTLHQQASVTSLSSHLPGTSPSPVSARTNSLLPGTSTQTRRGKYDASANLTPSADVDMNDPQVLQFYSQLLLFKEDPTRESMTFPPTLSPVQRRNIHTLSHHMGLAHVSKGVGDQRQVHIFRAHDFNQSPPIPQLNTGHNEHRRALNRAATTDFSDVRGSDGFYGTLGRQGSGYLGFPESAGGLSAAPNLRAAKSYADLRSYTPSPVPSTASFPATLNTNLNRLAAEYNTNHSATSTNPSLTPTQPSATREESLLVNGLGNMTLGSGFGTSGSPRGLRGVVSWDRETPGPIGGHRSFSTNFDESNRDRNQTVPSRQPRGPIPERGTGFSRNRTNGHHARGSDDLSSQSGVEIVVE